jgi:hypothetical protein
LTGSWFPYELDGPSRIANAESEIRDARTLIDHWLTSHQSDSSPTFARFVRHFQVLRDTFVAMLDTVADELQKKVRGADAASQYHSARVAERSVGVIRQAFRWYITKYEQRQGSNLDDAGGQGHDRSYGRVLLAADEVVRSCWDTPFERCGRTPPTAPLCFLDDSFDATATPRRARPNGFPSSDGILGPFFQRLPVPTISLPIGCLDEPWQLAVIAHEVGHHVQFDLDPTLPATTAAAVATAAGDTLGTDWARWAPESFADTWSVLMVGGAAGWIVGQLLADGPDELIIAPTTGLYPPPLIRLALIGELASALCVDSPGPTAEEIRAVLESPAFAATDEDKRRRHAEHLAVVPRLARVLLDHPTPAGPVRTASGFDLALLAGGGTAPTWGDDLIRGLIPQSDINKAYSARTIVAALSDGVRRIPLDNAQRGGYLNTLCQTGFDALQRSGRKGTLEDAKVDTVDTDALARDLIADLSEQVR